MDSLEEVLESRPLEAELDLAWFKLEGEANDFWSRMPLPQRFVFGMVTDDVMEVSLKGKDHVVAIYVRSKKRLYRGGGSLDLHWALVRSAMERVIGDDIDTVI